MPTDRFAPETKRDPRPTASTSTAFPGADPTCLGCTPRYRADGSLNTERTGVCAVCASLVGPLVA